jgi:hypothetical protein
VKLSRPELPALVIAGVAVLGIVLLAVLRQPIPDVLTLIASTALGAGAGQALPGLRDTAPAAAPVAVPAPVPAAPAPLYAEPSTGVFGRIAGDH